VKANNPLPKPSKALDGKLARVAAQPNVEMAVIAKWIPDAVRYKLAG